jgi:hypothetical protein
MSIKFDLWQTEREAAEVVEHGIKVLRKDGNHPSVKIWNPKATKPTANYWFKTVAQREDYVDKFVQRFAESKAAKAESRAQRNGTDAQADTVKVGDVFVHSWGYDQSNVDWYQVTHKSGRSVTVERIASREVPGSQGFMSAQVVAQPGVFLDKAPKVKRVQFTEDGRPFLSFEYGWCEKWAGEPRYSSWYA